MSELSKEIDRLKGKFPAAEENKIGALTALIEQAAHETIYLKELNAKAAVSGLVKCHPDHPEIQKSLPVSGEITKHAATLTNIMDKLMKYLAVDQDEDDDGLGDYE
jgi:hypothetical protein